MGVCVCVLFFVYVRMGDTDHHFIPSLSSDVSFWLHVLNEPDAVNYISILSPKSNAAEWESKFLIRRQSNSSTWLAKLSQGHWYAWHIFCPK